MKTRIKLSVIGHLLAVVGCLAHAQGTAFTYQGRLNSGGTPANGSYDLAFTLFTTNVTGSPLAGPVTNTAVTATNGLFTTLVDFGPGRFTSTSNWLEIAVRTNSLDSFVPLTPRQQLTPVPYALFAGAASNLMGLLPMAQLSGTLAAGQLPGGVLTNNAAGANLNGAFAGNGGGLTNLQLTAVGPVGEFSLTPLLFAAPLTVQAAGYPYQVVVADLNTDGKPDFASANDSGGATVFTNTGTGGFALSATLYANSYISAVAAGDVNGDGRLDLICANALASTLVIYTNSAGGLLRSNATLNVGKQPAGLLAVDVNGDGKLDLVSANAGTNTLTVLTNNGSGVFGFYATLTVGNGPWSVISTDVNGDGKPDLISANVFGYSFTILTNRVGGGFGSNATVYVGDNIYTVAAADVNGDGKVDLVTSDYTSGYVSVFLNNGTGIFNLNGNYPTGGWATSVVAADINSDGKADLVVANYSPSTLVVLTNNGSGGFGLYATLAVGGTPSGVAAADLNSDGKIDLISANDNAPTLSVLYKLNPPVSTLNVNGGLSSPLWKVTSPINSTGQLPLSGTFSSSGGTLLISVAGSGYTSAASTLIGMDIKLDGTTIDSATLFANPALTHLAFVPATIKAGAGVGPHTISLVARPGTITDTTDYFRVTIEELPF